MYSTLDGLSAIRSRSLPMLPRGGSPRSGEFTKTMRLCTHLTSSSVLDVNVDDEWS